MKRQKRAEKVKALEDKEYEGSWKVGLDAFFLFKQYFLPACWSKKEEAQSSYDKLTTKKDKLECVKEQILIRYIGLGWEDAHHPWSYKGCAFMADVLFDHLVNLVIPLKDINQIPIDPPVNLPKVGDGINFGAKSSAQKC